MKNQQGFTLIELVMVIVILGILAATALPKFANLQGNARMSSLNGALGAVKSASAIAHAASLVADSNNITIEGTNYTLVNGYPDDVNIAELAGISASDYDVLDNTNNVFKLTLGTCSFTYADASSANAAPVISAISNTNSTSSGC